MKPARGPQTRFFSNYCSGIPGLANYEMLNEVCEGNFWGAFFRHRASHPSHGGCYAYAMLCYAAACFFTAAVELQMSFWKIQGIGSWAQVLRHFIMPYNHEIEDAQSCIHSMRKWSKTKGGHLALDWVRVQVHSLRCPFPHLKQKKTLSAFRHAFC